MSVCIREFGCWSKYVHVRVIRLFIKWTWTTGCAEKKYTNSTVCLVKQNQVFWFTQQRFLLELIHKFEIGWHFEKFFTLYVVAIRVAKRFTMHLIAYFPKFKWYLLEFLSARVWIEGELLGKCILFLCAPCIQNPWSILVFNTSAIISFWIGTFKAVSTKLLSNISILSVVVFGKVKHIQTLGHLKKNTCLKSIVT